MPRERRPPSVDVTGTVWRWNSYDVAWWADRNRSPGRWHDEHSPATQYMALSASGAWAELIRFFGIRDPQDLAEARYNLWRGWVHAPGLADLTGDGAAARYGLPDGALVDRDHGVCQLEAHRLQRLGFTGVLTPSAALPGATNLVLWGPRRPIPWVPAGAADPTPGPPTFPSDVPTEHVAVGGPHAALVSEVRQRTP